MPSSAVTFAKRSLSLSKIQAGIAAFLAAFGILVLVAVSLTVQGSDQRFALLSIPEMVLAILMFASAVILLYVYDKNNGVLEYLLSLGWNQSRIFKHYLQAALFLALIMFLAELATSLVVSALFGTVASVVLVLMTMGIAAALGFATVSLVTAAMVAFSSLQKQRMGGNSPLALTLGVVAIIPTWATAYTGTFFFDAIFDLSIAALVGGISIVLMILSGRLIRREKMLP